MKTQELIAKQYYLTRAQFEAKKSAGTLEIGAEYNITDDSFQPAVKVESTDPTTSTAGVLGQQYLNSTTGSLFVCTAASSTYTWSKLSTITDVKINGTSIVSNNTANIPMAYQSTVGAVKVYDAGYGITSDASGQLKIWIGDWAKFNSVHPNRFLPVVSADLLLGMKKYLGSTITSTTSNTTWTDEEKTNARNTLGASGIINVEILEDGD